MNYGSGSVLGGGINAAGALAQKNYAADVQGYAGESTTAVDQTGLMRLAEQVAYSMARIDQITGGLNTLAVGIHGPRPEPVTGAENSKVHHDNLTARVSHLTEAVDRLHRAYESVVR